MSELWPLKEVSLMPSHTSSMALLLVVLLVVGVWWFRLFLLQVVVVVFIDEDDSILWKMKWGWIWNGEVGKGDKFGTLVSAV